MNLLQRSPKQALPPPFDPRGQESEDCQVAFNMSEADRVAKRQWMLAAFLFGIIALVAVSGYWHLVPLKTTVPYLVKVDDVGKYQAVGPLTQERPDAAMIRWRLKEWVREILTISPAYKQNIESASYLLTPKSKSELEEILKDRLQVGRLRAENPALTREAVPEWPSMLNESTAVVTVTIVDRQGGNTEPIKKKLIVTISFFISPKLEEDTIHNNPIGLFVDHFEVQEETHSARGL